MPGGMGGMPGAPPTLGRSSSAAGRLAADEWLVAQGALAGLGRRLRATTSTEPRKASERSKRRGARGVALCDSVCGQQKETLYILLASRDRGKGGRLLRGYGLRCACTTAFASRNPCRICSQQRSTVRASRQQSQPKPASLCCTHLALHVGDGTGCVGDEHRAASLGSAHLLQHVQVCKHGAPQR